MAWIWLSHSLNNETPLYGNSGVLKIDPDNSQEKGDSCNSHILTFSNHIGSHVDTPRHFLLDGRTLDSYSAEDWIFNNPYLLQKEIKDYGQLIGIDIFESIKEDLDADLLLIRTNFEAYRGDDIYWEKGPGLAPEFGANIKNYFPNLRAIGIDFISISSFQHRNHGRKAHLELLSRDIRLFEDLSLKGINESLPIDQVIALPLIFTNGDGAPSSIIAHQ